MATFLVSSERNLAPIVLILFLVCMLHSTKWRFPVYIKFSCVPCKQSFGFNLWTTAVARDVVQRQKEMQPSLLAKVTTVPVCCHAVSRGWSSECWPACFGKALFCLQGISFNASLTPRHLQPSWFSPGPLGAGWKQPSPLGHFSTEWALKTWEGCGSRKECGGVPKLAVTPPFLPPSPFSASFSLNFS